MLGTKIGRIPLLAIVVTSLGLAMGSCSVTTWDSVTPRYTPETAPHVTQWRPADTALYSVRAFGRNSFYAVGQAGTILRSVDGKRWLTQFSGTQADLHSIFGTADGKELWAVGDLGTILHSEDGEHWKSQVAGAARGLTLRCVFGTADGKQLWAAGDFGTILRSTDDERWVAQSTHTKNASLHSIFGTADGKQLWVVGEGGTILHSSDGEHWNAQDSNTQVALNSIFGAEDGKHLWAVGVVGGTFAPDGSFQQGAGEDALKGKIVHSVDGEHWSVSNVGMQADLHSIFGTSDGKQLWVVGETLKLLKQDSSGTVWRQAVRNPGVIFHSTDGEHWSAESKGISVQLNSISGTPDGRRLCAVGGVNLGLWSRGAILYSDGGKQWATEPRGTNAILYGIFATPDGKQMWAATGENSTILHSSDGDNWTTQYKGPQGVLYSIFGAEDGKHLWAAGVAGGTLAPDGSFVPGVDARGTIVHSLDGEHWTTTEATGAKGVLNSVFGTPDGKKLWAVGERGTILHSADGEHWTVQDSKTQAILTSIFGTPDGKNLWAVGMQDPSRLDRGSTILHTIDGEHWTIEDSNTYEDLYSIFGTPDGKQLWAVGGQSVLLTDRGFAAVKKSTGTIVHSTDGEHWSVQETTEHCLNYVFGTPDGKNLWAVGDDGAILHSADGEHWASQSSHSGGDLFFVFGTPVGKRLWVFGTSKHQGTVRTGLALDGFDIGRARYIAMARLRTTLTGARLELKLESPVPLISPTTLSLSARNDFDFENRRPPVYLGAVYNDATKGDPPGVYALNVDLSKAAIERGQRAHFEITLDDQLIKQQFDYAATYDPFGYFRENAKWLIPLVATVFVVACFTLFLFTKPLWNLYLYRQFKLYKVNEISIPGIGEPLKVALKSVAVLPWFVTHPRTLDAWIKQNRDRLEASWSIDVAQASLTEGRYPELSGAYIQLPIRIGDQTAGGVIQQPTAEDFNQIFSGSRWHVQIVGPGGAGKTTLARQIGRWALDGSLKGGRDRHAMLPIWIDEDVDSSNTVSKVVRDKLLAILSDEDIEVDFCDAMLRHQRLLVIIDRLSERSAETQECIRNIYRSTRLGALIITSRSKLPVDGISPSLLFPQPLSSASLLFFMTGLLSILGVKGTETNLELSPLRTISEQLDLGQRLSGLIQVRTGDGNQEIPILPLPVRLFIEQAVELLSNGSSLDDLPSSLPEVYVQYLRRINPKTASANLLSDEEMLKAAVALGKIALRPNFIPKEFAPEAAREALKKIGWVGFDGVDPIERLKANGVIVQKQIGAYSRLRFVLDPIAEFLAAFAYAEECGAKVEAWKQILDETSVAAPGFHIALQLIRQAYGSRLGWASD